MPGHRYLQFIFLSSIGAAVVAIAVFAAVTHRRALREAPPDAIEYSEDYLLLEPVRFEAISGWRQDDPSDAFAAYLRSCAKLVTRPVDEPINATARALETSVDYGVVGDWIEPCLAAQDIDRSTHADPAVRRAAIRTLFESYFRPFRVASARKPLTGDGAGDRFSESAESGKFTGYFEPEYLGARAPSADRPAPVLARPADLVEVDLGEFSDAFAGKRIAGRAENGRLRPYPDRQAISLSAEEIAAPLAWLRPADLFFMQIQGSGRVRFADGETRRFGYAGQNGHEYTAIGRVLVETGEMPLEAVSMQSIRAWLIAATPEKADALLNQNRSYVFFEDLGPPSGTLGPPGAQRVALTPVRSLAVDLRYHALGTPMWVALAAPDGEEPEFRRLMIAQDTGGAIRGPVRGDIFWGSGAAAAERAGRQNADGVLYTLLPDAVARRITTGAAQ